MMRENSKINSAIGGRLVLVILLIAYIFGYLIIEHVLKAGPPESLINFSQDLIGRVTPISLLVILGIIFLIYRLGLNAGGLIVRNKRFVKVGVITGIKAVLIIATGIILIGLSSSSSVELADFGEVLQHVVLFYYFWVLVLGLLPLIVLGVFYGWIIFRAME